MYAAEQHAVFNVALYQTAVRHDGVDRAAFADVACGEFVLYLGIDGVIVAEQLLGHGLVEQRHIVPVIVVDAVEPCDVAGKLIPADVELMDVAHKHVVRKIIARV